MCHPVARRGGPAVGAVLNRQLLWHDVTIGTDGRAAAELDLLLATATHPMDAACRIRYDLAGGDAAGRDEAHTIVEDGDVLAQGLSTVEARDLIHQRAHRRAFELASRKGWVRLHGGVIDVDGHRVVVLGPSGAGKTSLCVRLMLDGGDLQGDESFLLRGDEVLAVPRPLHLKPGGAAVNPDLGTVVAPLPEVDGLALLDPRRQLGRPWALTVAPVDVLVLLEPADGRAVHSRPLSIADALPVVVDQLFPLVETKSALIDAAAGFVSGVRRHRLSVGDTAAMSNEIGLLIS